MIRLIFSLLGLLALVYGFSWLADRPGSILINWEGYQIEVTVFRAVVLSALLLAFGAFFWSLARQILTSPAMLGRYFSRRRQEKGLDALSSGMIAIGAGDRAMALRHASQARRALPNEPLTQLLRAQAAELAGDRSTSRRIFEAMLSSPDTEQLGLRGLFLEAQREREDEAARQFAERAMRLNPKLGWPVDAVFDIKCREGDWLGALETLAIGRKSGIYERDVADRRRAVLLTAKAQELEETQGAKALQLASEAHGLAPSLIPAAVIAARQLASRGSTAKAAKVVERTWKLAQHPDLALVYAFARPGDSPRDRLERIRRLSRTTPQSAEGPIALASAAIEARAWGEARAALAPLLEDGLSQRVCTLMARIEGGENNDAGRVREWLSRAINAERDPAWTADGVVSDRWSPTSPVTGALDAFAWRVPPESTGESDAGRALKQIEELVLLGAHPAAEPGKTRPLKTDAAASAHPDPVAEPLRRRTAGDDDNRPMTVEVEPIDETREMPTARPPVATSPSPSGLPLHGAHPGKADGSRKPDPVAAGSPGTVADQRTVEPN